FAQRWDHGLPSHPRLRCCRLSAASAVMDCCWFLTLPVREFHSVHSPLDQVPRDYFCSTAFGAFCGFCPFGALAGGLSKSSGSVQSIFHAPFSLLARSTIVFGVPDAES